MSITQLLLLSLGGYFGLLSLLAWLSNRRQQDSLSGFFVAGRQAPWLMVAIGMVGSSLSGLTFISVPGKVGAGSDFTYLQVALGYCLGYVVIAQVLLPLYYRLRLTSIYGYLGQRFGRRSYLTGAWLFLVSRGLGSAVRLYLAIIVLQGVLFPQSGPPFWLMAVLTVGFIVVYTWRGGIRTVIYTDVLQTLVMLLAIALVWVQLAPPGDLLGSWGRVWHSSYSRVFDWDWQSADYFFKSFFAGMFITIVMTGLDQDMMQKNLSIRTLQHAKRNMYLYSGLILLANVFFVAFGAMLYLEAGRLGWGQGVAADQFFPQFVLQNMGGSAAILVVIGLVAAAYSSADGTLAALTTSYCVDILGLREDQEKSQLTRRRVQLGVAVAYTVAILLFYYTTQWLGKAVSAIDLALQLAGYTYGPLLGLYAFGIFTRHGVRDAAVPVLAVAIPLLCWGLSRLAPVWWGYAFGFELLLVNGALMYAALWLLRKGHVAPLSPVVSA